MVDTPGHQEQRPPIARSAPECHLFIDLHPCVCGEGVLDAKHVLTQRPGALGAVYEGTCPRCGRERRFTFELDPALPPPPPSFGGDAPSRIICPGQFMLAADGWAGRRHPSAEIHRAALARAVAAVEEVLKFIPPGADAVPPGAFTSPEGRAAYGREPGRFQRARLEAVRAAYEDALARA